MANPRDPGADAVDSFFGAMNAVETCWGHTARGTATGRRRRKAALATSTEAIESRLLLTMPYPYGMPGTMQQPPVTGNISLAVNYNYISPDLVFNGVGDQSLPGVARYDSSVPFVFSGQTSGMAKLRITHPDGQSYTTNVNG